MIELLNVDCMEYMATQKDNAFDLAIVDPPYGIGNDCLKNNATRTKLAKAKKYKLYANNKENRPIHEYFLELKRVSKNQIIWGVNHFANLFDASGSGYIVWDKQTTGNFSDVEIAYSSFNCSAKKFTYQWNGMLQGNHGDKKKNETRIHPSQKPIALYKWLLQKFSDPGQNILDTHLGSGSSAIAAHYFGCDFVGCEIDKEYLDKSKERFEKETRQIPLF